MAVAKGADIPKHRLLDTVEATEHALARFTAWAHVRASEVVVRWEGMPDGLDALDPVDAMQIKLAAWQTDRFGHVPHSDVHMALGVIEELGEAFDEDATPEDAIDALGDVMIYSSQLCTANRMAVGPVIDLACLYLKANHCHGHAITIAGMLAHVALKHDQQIRGLGPIDVYRPRLVDALAMMIAKALEDCTVGHELTVDPRAVFVVIGREVTERKAGDAMIPTAVPVPDAVREAIAADRKAAALEGLQAGAELLGEAEKTEPGDFKIERDRFGQPIAVDA